MLTLGADGAMVFQADGEPLRARPQSGIEVVDAVGAGDALASILILGLRLGWPIATTMERVQAFASELVQPYPISGSTARFPSNGV